jgi:tRNA(Ile)-lysidine synthetase-like protein
MQLGLEPGKYVLAVSGGVDSMVLLDMLRQQPELKLVVAHFDHGIREDSHQDRKLVQDHAGKHGLPFIHKNGMLGVGASEAVARKARYDFLHQVRQASGAKAIITAHHQDDVLETAILNLLRGTGRRGLASLRSRDTLRRPLVDVTKRQIHAYALSHKLIWREDSTNQNEDYLRNYVRRKILPRFSLAQRRQLLDIVKDMAETNRELDTRLINYLHTQPAIDELGRQDFILLPHNAAREVLAAWLRNHNIRNFDRRTLERLVVAAKTGKRGDLADVLQNHRLFIGRETLALRSNER